MENLNSEQIKKALKYCTDGGRCFDCQYDKGNSFTKEGCMASHMRDALSLITSQEQRIRELAVELDDAKRDTIPKLRLSLERANAMGVEADKTIEKLTEENERLREKANRNLKNLKAVLDERSERNIVADTVKKMHSEIKERCIKGSIYPTFVARTIDQIAKELLEENK